MPLVDIKPRKQYKGPLILVPVPGARPGVCARMTEEEAIDRGYLSPRDEGAKREEPVHNKARRTAPNKARTPGDEEMGRPGDAETGRG